MLISDNFRREAKPVSPFNIQLLENDQEKGCQAGSVADPAKHYEVILVMEGKGICNVGMDIYQLLPWTICMIRPGVTRQWKNEGKAKGFHLWFTPAFLPLPMENNLQTHCICIDGLDGGNGERVGNPVITNLIQVIQAIYSESRQQSPYKDLMVQSLLKVFQLYIIRLLENETMVLYRRKHMIVERFLKLLEEKYHTLHRPGDYAQILSVTANHLNNVVKQVSGFKTTYHIHQRLLQEAKRLAIHEDYSMKQVAYRLGFEDPCHFSKFFKNTYGQGFREFKQKGMRWIV